MVGLHQNRTLREHMEKRFADAWADTNRTSKTLAWLLTGGNQSGSPKDPAPKAKQVAATVVQWLGSEVGLHFLAEALGVEGAKDVLERAKAMVAAPMNREASIESLDELKQLVQEIVGPRETWDDEDKDWQSIYDKIFCQNIMGAARKFNVDWCDPDATYEEDVLAFYKELIDAY